MTKSEAQWINNVPYGTIIFRGSVRGDPNDKFEVPFGVIKAMNKGYSGFITLLESSRYYNLDLTDDEIKYEFPHLSGIYTYGMPATSLHGRLWNVSGGSFGYDSLYGPVEDKFLNLDEIIKRTALYAYKVYLFSRPKGLEGQLDLGVF